MEFKSYIAKFGEPDSKGKIFRDGCLDHKLGKTESGAEICKDEIGYYVVFDADMKDSKENKEN